MKIIYICLLLIFAGTELILAQTEKGTQYLGLEAAGSVKTTKSTDAPNTTQREQNYSITPAYSYFFADQWELKGGLGLSVSSTRTKGNGDDSKSSAYALTPSIALKRHLMLSESLGIAGGPYGSYAFSKQTTSRERVRNQSCTKLVQTYISNIFSCSVSVSLPDCLEFRIAR